MKHIYTFLALLAGCLLAASPHRAAAATEPADGYYYIKSGLSSLYNSMASGVICENTDKSLSYMVQPEAASDYYRAVWKVTKGTDGTFSIQNARTGHYIHAVTVAGWQYSADETSYGFTIAYSCTANETDYYNIWNDTDHTLGLNANNLSTGIWAWQTTGTATSLSGNEWQLVPLTLSDEDVKKAAGSWTGHSGVYRITSATETTSVLRESFDGTVACTESSASDTEYPELWQLTETSDGYYTIQNVATGNYIQAQTTKDSPYTTASETGNAFLISFNRTSSGTEYFNLWNDSSQALNINNAQAANKAVAWDEASVSGALDNGEWSFTAVSLDEATITATRAQYADLSGVYAIESGVVKSVITESSNNLTYKAYNSSSYATDHVSLWLLRRTNFREYTIQNVQTGHFVQPQTTDNTQYATGTSAHSFFVIPNASITSGTYYNFFNDANKAESFNRQWSSGSGDTSGKVVSWSEVGSGSVDNGEWKLLPVTLSDDDILAARSAYYGYSAPTAGKIYQIYNPSRDTYLTVSGTGSSCQLQHLSKKTGDYSAYSQYWRLTASGNGFKMTNIYTQKSFAAIPSDGRAYSANDTGDAYLIMANSSMQLLPYYNIKAQSTSTWMPHAEAGGAVVNWPASTDGSLTATEWAFKEITLTDDQIAAAQADYSAAATLIDNASTYAAALQTFFTDKACTTLGDTYTAMTDDELTSAMSALPEQLQQMAVKIKDNTWADYEKEFRIASFQPYSDPTQWAWKVGNGYVYGRLEQPTGIYVHEGDILMVCAGQDAPTDATLYAEILGENSSTGPQTALAAGLNIFRASQDGNLFVSYHCDTHSGTHVLADFPDITVHVAAGGTVNGYFDARAKTADGHRGKTDADWVQMQKDGLFTATTLNLRSEQIMFSMDAALVKQYTPVKIRELLAVWDSVATIENNLIGLNDTYWPGLSTKFNNIFGAYSIPSNYMYATSYGTYYNKTTLSTVMSNSAMHVNYSDPATGTTAAANDEATGSPGTIWGPAHENGHLRQNLINIIGDTEVSNNLHSNVVVWERGFSGTRGEKLEKTFACFQEGKFYLDYAERLRMYWQLYLYYEVAGHHPGFFPELFTALRSDPMTRKSGVVNYGKDNYLKFARKCCDVSGDNLTDFFTAWGFFVPVENRYVDDYANYYLTTTQDDIDETKAYMKQFADGAENIMFIEDRIENTQAGFPGATEGQLRMSYSTEWVTGDCGDTGSYTDYADGTHASEYLYTVSGSTVTINSGSTGAVGYKVYDASGNLVALSNNNTFTLPSGLTDYVIKAAQADGTDVEIPNSNSTYYTLSAYYGSDEAHTLYAATEAPATRTANTVFIAPADAPAAITGAENVVTQATDGTCTATSFTLTDKKDFYTPKAFTAATLTYTRDNTAGWNSLCLPFAVTADDLGSGSKIENISDINDDDESSPALTFNETDESVAGQPCLAWCPDDVTTWSITKSDAAVAASPVPITSNSVSLLGSYTSKTIGADKYKLNQAGTAFGITTAAGKITAFRCYAEIDGNSPARPARLTILHGGTSTGIHGAETTAPADNAAWYDLQGRRVNHPASGVYIHQGRKVIIK